jgi:hypothetical protein
MTYLDWLKTLPEFDANYASAACPNCGIKGALKYQYFGFPHGHFGWKLVWCSNCHTGISMSRVKIPDGEAAISDASEQQRLMEEIGPLKLVT